MAKTKSISGQLRKRLATHYCITEDDARRCGAKNPSASIAYLKKQHGLIRHKTDRGIAYCMPQHCDRHVDDAIEASLPHVVDYRKPTVLRVFVKICLIFGIGCLLVWGWFMLTSNEVHALSFPWSRTATERLVENSETMNAAAQTYRAARLEYLRTQIEVASEKSQDGRECSTKPCAQVLADNAAEIRAILGNNTLPRF